MLANALEKSLYDDDLSDAQRANAVAGLEALRAMVDQVRELEGQRRAGVIGSSGRPLYTPARLKKLLPTWDTHVSQAERYLLAANPGGFKEYSSRVMQSMGGMGIWSWNPNLWGKTTEEAAAYEKAQLATKLDKTKLQAEIDAAAAAGEAEADRLNPSLLSTGSKSLQSGLESMATTANMMLALLVVGTAAVGYTVYRESKKGGVIHEAVEKHLT